MGREDEASTRENLLMTCSLNVARLANVPQSVLNIAAVKSKELEDDAAEKAVSHL